MKNFCHISIRPRIFPWRSFTKDMNGEMVYFKNDDIVWCWSRCHETCVRSVKGIVWIASRSRAERFSFSRGATRNEYRRCGRDREEVVSAGALWSAILWPPVYLPFKEFSSPTTATNFHLELQCKPFEALSFLSTFALEHISSLVSSVCVCESRAQHSQPGFVSANDRHDERSSAERTNKKTDSLFISVSSSSHAQASRGDNVQTFSHFSGSVWWRRTTQNIREWTIRIYLIFFWRQIQK